MSTDTPATPATAAASVAKNPARHLRLLGFVVAIAGAVLALSGAITYATVSQTLGDEQITVSDDAAHFAGDDVNGPLTAYSEAQTIEKHAMKASGGKTYAELGKEDPIRVTVMNGSFLRASLFTSVVSFGVAAMAFGIGILFVVVGWALLLIEKSLRPVSTV
jgi:hypothetical protein